MRFSSNEAKVGSLVILTGALIVVFGWVLGVQNPFNRSVDFYVTYNFAGGIEVGSPVRVSGIKVGKVESIDFFVPQANQTVALKEPGSATEKNPEISAVTPLRLKLSVRRDAAVGIRQDSRFYVNMAGIIGERYIEITAGTSDAPKVESDTVVAGIDPPRIDQLLSQSFDLAGKIKEIIDENKGEFTKSVELLYKMSANINRTVMAVEKSKLFQTDLASLINNLIQITSDVRRITDEFHSPEGKKTLDLLHTLLWRLEPLDSKTVRDFLQKEGVRARIF